MVPLDRLIQPIWEASPDPIAIITFDSDPRKRRYVYINPAFTEATGYSRAEAIGRLATFLHGPKTDAAAIQECEFVIGQGKPCRTALTQYRKDGSEYVAHATVAPLVEPNGSAQYLISVGAVDFLTNRGAQARSTTNCGVVVPLFLPMPLREFPAGELPQHLDSHPEIDAVRALWEKMRGDRMLPQRADFELKPMSRWAAHLSVATVMPMGRFQYRLFGTELARVYGQDLTGRFLDELTPRDLWSVIILHYQEVVRTLAPLFAPISLANGRWYSEVSRLLLPLANDSEGRKIAFVMGVDYPRTLP